ncbi:unnamed protein product [Schistosoma haematobium]|nr:unnamed protein product [Schistosoma haematobium]
MVISRICYQEVLVSVRGYWCGNSSFRYSCRFVVSDIRAGSLVSCVHDGDQSYLLSGGFGQCSWILVRKFQFQIFVPVRW